MRNGVLVEKRLAPPKNYGQPATYIISDVMDPLKHPGTGQIIDSKAKFREHTRASGCVEVGTDPAASTPKPRIEPSIHDIAMDVKRSIAELRSR